MQPIGGLTWRVDEDTAGEINATAEARRAKLA
jgi:hypothetical protein